MSLPDLLQLADRQYGVFSVAQAKQLGVPRQRLSEYRNKGLIERVHPGVDRPLGAPLGYEGELMAACLAGGPGTAVSHRAAARLWRLGSLASGRPEVISPRWKRLRRMGIDAHQSNLFDEAEITQLEGFPVVTVLRCLFLLGAVERPAVVAQCLDEAIARGVVSLDEVRAELTRLGASGRNGIGAVRLALELKDYSPGTSESALEQKFLALVLAAGLPAPVRQFPVVTRHGEFRIDFAYPDRRLAIELDGRRWHDREEAFQRDRVRQNALTEAGWAVSRYTSDDVALRPSSVQIGVRTLLLDTGGFRPIRTK